MATTYTKPLKSIVITTLGGNTFNVADTATNPMASGALAEFEAYKTMHFEANNANVLVPFHAVDNITVTESTSDSITREDPVCEE